MNNVYTDDTAHTNTVARTIANDDPKRIATVATASDDKNTKSAMSPASIPSPSPAATPSILQILTNSPHGTFRGQPNSVDNSNSNSNRAPHRSKKNKNPRHLPPCRVYNRYHNDARSKQQWINDHEYIMSDLWEHVLGFLNTSNSLCLDRCTYVDFTKFVEKFSTNFDEYRRR